MQRYNKRENKTIKKTNLVEVVGSREELKPFLNKTLNCEVFVTNSLGYLGEKRLLTEIRIPETDFYIKHLWVKEYNLPIKNIPHGYRKINLKVIQYSDKITQEIKYGVRIANPKKQPQNKMIKPRWMK